ncbi:hypothetical protein R1flu_011917 [Riccia fluitans]|uniref:WRC domain-containing protein n=1 Tax=Riccia fluitans TaxID=41844 RepID=A0ABD1ZA26_9MARC
MRIRKNRTSSRVPPGFCLAHGITQEAQNFRKLNASESLSPQLGKPLTQIVKPVLDSGKLHVDFNRIHDSLDDECTSIKIRDSVLEHRESARLGGCKKQHHVSSESRDRQSGSESDAGRVTASTKRAAEQHKSGKPPRVPAPLTEKSNPSSRPTGKRRKAQLQEVPAVESEIPKLTTKSGTGTGHIKNDTGIRKRRRSKVEPDLSIALKRKKGTAETRLEDEGGGYAHEPAADTEVSSGTTERKLTVEEEHQGSGSTGKSDPASPSCFPAGWSYRGLAQIAEQDKLPQGKQCSRTDGRSWRCPLKVHNGYTLCEHHLSKFRLKKVSKENKRHKYLQVRRQRQRQQQQLQWEEDDEQQQVEQETPNSTPDENDIAESAQTSASMERDVSMRFRKRHKTIKLSVL